MKHLLYIICISLISTASYSQLNNHSAFNDLLQQNVTSTGKVNYDGFIKNISKLDSYLAQLSKSMPTSSTSSNEAKAYWLNAYNAFTIKLICDNYPVKSIMDIENGKPWDKKWIKLGGKTYSLNQIENDIIRPKYKDGRIHFAVNCAAKSCPPLLNKAFTNNNVEKTLASRTMRFINDSSFNTIHKNTIVLSKIFEWYGKDFGNLISFINKYSKIKASEDAKVSYKEYNWSLNK